MNATAPVFPNGKAIASRAARIALLLDNLGTGGAQRRIATLANRMADLGRAVDVVSVNPGGPLRTLLAPRPRIVTLMPNGATRHLTQAIHARSLARYLDEAEPDVLMSCVTDTHLMAVAGRALASRRRPLVLRASRHPYRSLPWWKSLLEPLKVRKTAWCYAHADALVALSSEGAAGLRRALRGRLVRIETILNPVVESTLLDEQPMHVPQRPGPVPIILGVGRLVEQKDFATLLRAFALVRTSRPARLVLLGDGPQRGRLEALARSLGISADCDMPGEVADVAGWMRSADLVVSSSLWEGLQATLVEALAVGCPVVATQCPGAARETLENGRLGPLVPVRDPVRMAEAIRTVLDSPPDPLALATSASRFTTAGKAERYLDLFDDLLIPSSTAATDVR